MGEEYGFIKMDTFAHEKHPRTTPSTTLMGTFVAENEIVRRAAVFVGCRGFSNRRGCTKCSEGRRTVERALAIRSSLRRPILQWASVPLPEQRCIGSNCTWPDYLPRVKRAPYGMAR